ncbi:MAG: M48 family metalloprotease [Nitrospirota bacterium]|nr:M48 family metalloprotease [Nitrospirota bacterium]
MILSSGITKALAGIALVLVLPLLAQAVEMKARERWHSQDMDVVESDIVAEVKFGREVAARIVGRYGLYDDDQVNRYVNLVGSSVAVSANRPELIFRFAVLDTQEINAYAAPGGYIFVTKGALAQMQDEAELATVLAHEVAHVAGRHVVKELNIKGAEGGAAGGMARLAGGATEAARATMGQIVDKAVDILFKDGYKREDEIQADRDSILYSTVANYDASALIRYFERLNAVKGKSTEVLDKTHPTYDARISWLKDTINGEGIDPYKMKSNKDRFQESVKTAELIKK